MRVPSIRTAAAASAATLALAACDAVEPSEYVNQSRIYTEYELHYDGGRDVTTAKATFRFGGASGTLLELSGDSRVTANGQAMSRVRQPLTNVTYYERAFAGQAGAATFVFRDTEGRSYQNAVTLRPIGFPAGGVGAIDNDASYELVWDGPELAAGEEVTATLYRFGTGGTALGVFHQRSDGTRSIILDRSQLQNVTPGTVTLTLERKVTATPAERPAAGGRVVARYGAPSISAQVVD